MLLLLESQNIGLGRGPQGSWLHAEPPQNQTLCLRALSKHSLNCGMLGAVPTALGSPSSAQATIGSCSPPAGRWTRGVCTLPFGGEHSQYKLCPTLSLPGWAWRSLSLPASPTECRVVWLLGSYIKTHAGFLKHPSFPVSLTFVLTGLQVTACNACSHCLSKTLRHVCFYPTLEKSWCSFSFFFWENNPLVTNLELIF